VGSKIRIKDLSANKTYDRSGVTAVEFQGGNGNDRFVNMVRYLPTRAFGNGGNDYLEGYDGVDVLVGGSGNDTIKGYGGNDRLYGGSGNDYIDAGSGNDYAYGNDGNDTIKGGYGNDYLNGGNHNDTLLGESGNDRINGMSGNDHINGGSGTDTMWGGSGDDVIIAIDNGTLDYVQSDTGRDSIWVDRTGSSSDRMYGNSSYDLVNQVSSFSNGADRTLNGDSIADPSVKSGHTYRNFSGNDLFSSRGPDMEDVVQGELGDCYFLAGLGAIAEDSPHAIRQSIVDFNDGTYGVRYGNSFYRLDSDLPVSSSSSTTPAYAKLGRGNSMWVAIAEKAWAHHRRGQNSYASTEGGWSVEVNQAFRSSSTFNVSLGRFSSATALGNYIYNKFRNNEAVTVGFTGNKKAGNGELITGHMYTVAGVNRNSYGTVTSIMLRNPWGVDGATVEGADDGYVWVTPAQLRNMYGAVNGGRV
ncbi:MAG: hypothetical protein KDA78_06555, partial [Planctomycetaceae bacterium]|nr:hypothetical protein [Planctomycetaceae bacterium]